MKVLVISAAFPPTKAGEADHAFHLCQKLSDRGLDIHVVTTNKRVDSRVLQAPFKVYPIMRRWLWPDLPRLACFIKRCAPNAILLIFTDRDYDYHPMIMFSPLISKLVLPNAPFVTQLETQFLSRKASIFTQALLKTTARCLGPKYLDYGYGTLLSASDRVILLSEDHRRKFAEIFSRIESKTLVIPPAPIMRVVDDPAGFWRERGRESLGATSKDFVMAYFGYIYPDKGIETLFRAFQMVSRRADTRLVMIGSALGSSHESSYLGGIHRLARDLAIQDRILWTGEYESDSTTPSMYLRAADACVLPFDYGVTLNRSSVAAAAAHGLPIITTRGENLELAFREGDNVLLCPPRDPEALAGAMGQLISDASFRDRLREGALQLSRDYFSWDRTIAQTISALTNGPEQ
jgi:glycosyltransferase involved in cell wall biosynthesis